MVNISVFGLCAAALLRASVRRLLPGKFMPSLPHCAFRPACLPLSHLTRVHSVTSELLFTSNSPCRHVISLIAREAVSCPYGGGSLLHYWAPARLEALRCQHLLCI